MTSGWRLWRRGIAGMGLLLMAFATAAAAPDMAETPRLRRFGAAEGMPSRMVLALAEIARAMPGRHRWWPGAL